MINVAKLDEYKNKGECFSITSYCNSESKLNVLNNTIDNLKQYGLPIFLHAHYVVPEEIQKKVHACFYSSDNPIFNRFNDFWGFTDGYNVDCVNWGLTSGYKMVITEFDYYYTTLKGWDESIKILEDYDRIHMINYDTNVYPELFNLSRKIDKSIFLEHNFFDRNKQHIFLLYFCLNKKSFNFFREKITVDKYVGYWALSQSKFLPHPEEMVGSFIINNDDFYVVPYTETDFDKMLANDVSTDARIDWSTLGKLEKSRVFIGEYNGKASILFYDVKEELRINIIINGFDKTFNISSMHLFDLYMDFHQIGSLKIFVNNILINDDLIKKFIRLESKIYKI